MIWTRILSLVFGATTYTFSLILAVFLIGLGIGSSLGAALAREAARPRVALGWCQMLLCGAMAWAAYMLTQSLPYWPINPSISTDTWFNFQLDLVRCLWVKASAATLGASFPRAGGRRHSWSGPREAGGRVRRQYRRRHRRVARGQPVAGLVLAASTRSRC